MRRRPQQQHVQEPSPQPSSKSPQASFERDTAWRSDPVHLAEERAKQEIQAELLRAQIAAKQQLKRESLERERWQAPPPPEISPQPSSKSPQTSFERDTAWRSDIAHLTEERAKQELQAELLREQIAEKQAKKEALERERRRREAKELADMQGYNPFGRGGGGAPMRDNMGNVRADLRRSGPSDALEWTATNLASLQPEAAAMEPPPVIQYYFQEIGTRCKRDIEVNKRTRS